AAAQHVAKPGELRILVIGIADDVEGSLRDAAHGVDIAQRVGRSDLAVKIGVVDHGRKKIDRLHERNVIAEPVDAGVIVSFGADEHVRVGERSEIAQNLRDALGRQLPRSAGARSVIDQALFAAKEQHGVRRQNTTTDYTDDTDENSTVFLIRVISVIRG